MAWSDAARRAAAEARRLRRTKLYTPGGNAEQRIHVGRDQMARMLKETRSMGRRGPGESVNAVHVTVNQGRVSGPKYFTNVKGAHNVDQGLKGKVWRSRSGKRGPKGGVPKWAAKSIGYTK